MGNLFEHPQRDVALFENLEKEVALEINSTNPCLEIFLIDISYNLIARGIQNLVTNVLPGIYSIKYKAGNSIEKKDILVRGNKDIEFFEAPEINPQSNIPFYSNNNDKKQNQIINYLESTNNFDFIDINSESNDSGEFFVFINPLNEEEKSIIGYKDIFLESLDNKELIDFNKIGYKQTIDTNFTFYFCKIRLKTGAYILKSNVGHGFFVSQTIIISKGWMTLFFSNYQEDEKKNSLYWDIANSSILMKKVGSNIFDLNNSETKLVEHARNALILRRNKIAKTLLEKLSKENFNDPMLGIFALHLMINSKEIEVELVKKVYNKIKDMIGAHPDLESIALHKDLITIFKSNFKFDNLPPMLSSSWDLILNASIEKPEIVNYQSFTGEIRNITSSSWFSWQNIPINYETFYEWEAYYKSVLKFINKDNIDFYRTISLLLKNNFIKEIFGINQKYYKNIDLIALIIDIGIKLVEKNDTFHEILKVLQKESLSQIILEILEFIIVTASKTLMLIKNNLNQENIDTLYEIINPSLKFFNLLSFIYYKKYSYIIEEIKEEFLKIFENFNLNLVNFVRVPNGVIEEVISIFLYNLGKFFAENNQVDLGINFLEVAINFPNASEDTFSDLGYLYNFIHKNPFIILSALEKGIKKYPDSFILNYNIGTLFIIILSNDKNNNFKTKALTYLNNALKLHQKDELIKLSDIYTNIANIYNSFSDVEKTIEYMEKAYELAPKDFNTCFNLGTLYGSGKNDFDKAIKYLKESIEITPNSSEASTNLAIAYNYNNEFENSKIYFEKALKNTNNFDEELNIIFNYANLLAYNNKFDQAIEKYKSCLKGDKEYIPAIFNLALTFISKNNIKEAINYFLQVNNYKAYYLLAWCHNYLQEYDKSISYLEKSIELNNNSIESLIFLSDLYNKNNPLKVIELLEKVMKINEERDIKIESDKLWKIYNNIGASYITIKNFQKAKEYLSKAENIQPESSEVKLNLAIAFYLNNEKEISESYLKRISNQDYQNSFEKFKTLDNGENFKEIPFFTLPNDNIEDIKSKFTINSKFTEPKVAA